MASPRHIRGERAYSSEPIDCDACGHAYTADYMREVDAVGGTRDLCLNCVANQSRTITISVRGAQ